MTSTPTPTSAPVRLRDHWRDPVRVEADDAHTLERAADVLTAAGYLLTEPPHGTNPGRGRAFWCDEDFDTRNLQRTLVRAGITAVIASTTLPTPTEAAEDEAAWQEAEALMEAEAQAAVEAEAKQSAPEVWAPF